MISPTYFLKFILNNGFFIEEYNQNSVYYTLKSRHVVLLQYGNHGHLTNVVLMDDDRVRILAHIIVEDNGGTPESSFWDKEITDIEWVKIKLAS